MATPAASAFHRRRLINSSSPNGLATAQRPAQTGALAMQQVLATARAPSTHRNRNYAQHRPVPVPSSFSLHSILYSLVSPLLSFAHDSLPQVAAATIISLLLAQLLRTFLISTVGSLLLSCPARPPPLPISVVFVNLFLLLLLIPLIIFSHYFLFYTASTAPSRPRHMFASFVSAPSLAIVFSYLLYGPFLSPHHFFCTVPTSIFPTPRAIAAPLIIGFFSAPSLSILTFRLRPHTPPPYPFPRSALRRALSAFPPALLVAILPTLPALIPTLGYVLFTRPPRSFYPSLLLTLSRSLSAAFAATTALLPHTLLLAFYPQSKAPLSTPPPPFAVQDARQTLANAPNSAPADVRVAITTLTAHPVNLHPFPPFSDPSGRVWRATIEAALEPIISMVDKLRVSGFPDPSALQPGLYPNPRLDPSSTQQNGNVLSQHSATLPSTASLPFDEVRDSLTALRYLPGLFAASRVHDSYGVAHPTLPHALAMLLLLRERAVAALAAAPQDSRPLWWLPRLLQALRPAPSTASLAAIVDAATVCIYRFTDMFREQAVIYVEGREIGWDASASPMLVRFLSFSA